MPTAEEIDARARQLFKECGGRDDLEWGAVDEVVRTHYRKWAMGILMMEDHIADNILGCVTS